MDGMEVKKAISGDLAKLSSSAAKLEEVEVALDVDINMETAKKYIELHKEIKDIITQYAALVYKDTEDLSGAVVALTAADMAVAAGLGGK